MGVSYRESALWWWKHCNIFSKSKMMMIKPWWTRTPDDSNDHHHPIHNKLREKVTVTCLFVLDIMADSACRLRLSLCGYMQNPYLYLKQVHLAFYFLSSSSFIALFLRLGQRRNEIWCWTCSTISIRSIHNNDFYCLPNTITLPLEQLLGTWNNGFFSLFKYYKLLFRNTVVRHLCDFLKKAGRACVFVCE